MLQSRQTTSTNYKFPSFEELFSDDHLKNNIQYISFENELKAYHEQLSKLKETVRSI